MRVVIESVFPCRAELVWAEVQTSRLLLEVARPLVIIRPVRGEVFPEKWTESLTVGARLSVFGLIPLGRQTLFFERIDHHSREIQTRETGRLVRRWDHRIRVQPLNGGRCRYSDVIEIEAGRLTPTIALFARWFYRHRHRRWQAVAKRLQAGQSENDIELIP